jgi:hypothetical protein
MPANSYTSDELILHFRQNGNSVEFNAELDWHGIFAIIGMYHHLNRRWYGYNVF